VLPGTSPEALKVTDTLCPFAGIKATIPKNTIIALNRDMTLFFIIIRGFY
jgi:hypothetical protein